MARIKGAKNKRSFNAELLAQQMDCDPLEILLWVAQGDWKALGFDAPSKVSYTSAGIEFEEPWIRLQDRVKAAGEACKYLYATKQAVQLSSEGEGFKIVVEDYTKAK
jgi:hypothetical protein